MTDRSERPVTRPTDGSVAADLLDRAIVYLEGTGDTSVSLRSLATALGTSHRMLQYHFGSKRRLISTLILELKARDPLVVPVPVSRADFLRKSWKIYRTPAQQLQLGLFFVLLDDQEGASDAERARMRGLLESWTGPFISLGMKEGLSEEQSRSEARLIVAALRGLQRDLIATGDEAAVDDAHAAMVAWVEREPKR